jgi:hypothetical protein
MPPSHWDWHVSVALSHLSVYYSIEIDSLLAIFTTKYVFLSPKGFLNCFVPIRNRVVCRSLLGYNSITIRDCRSPLLLGSKHTYAIIAIISFLVFGWA